MDDEIDRVFGAVYTEEKRHCYQKKVRLPCENITCRFNKEKGCNKTIAYHPIFIEGKCQSFQYDS